MKSSSTSTQLIALLRFVFYILSNLLVLVIGHVSAILLDLIAALTLPWLVLATVSLSTLVALLASLSLSTNLA